MNGGLLTQVLGSVLSGRSGAGGLGGLGGGLGGLGGLGAGARGLPGGLGGGKGDLMMMLLPLAMRWIQRNGGLGAVLQRANQRGYGQQASSWVGTGENEAMSVDGLKDLMGPDELAQLSGEVGAPQEEVAQQLAQILPELVNHATPGGRVPDDADDRLSQGQQVLEQSLRQG